MATRDRRRTVPKLGHEAVREHLVDYHFGRLSPQMNAAVERHIQSCQICQRDGLNHLATQKREAVRLSRRRPARRDRARPLRLLALLLTVVLLVLLVLVASSRGRHLPWSTSGTLVTPTTTSLPSPTATPTPATLAAALTFGPASSGSAAIAISPDGKWVAMSGTHNGVASITVWDAKSGTQAHTLPYGYAAPAASLVWSPDGTRLAAANGSSVVVWNVAQAAQMWALLLPQPPAMRVYDTQAAVVVQRLDPAAAFGQGASLQWGANGQLTPSAPGGASAPGAAAVDGPQVSVWQVAGSHLYAAGGGKVYVGDSAADLAAHEAFLTWSPDGRYLLWATMSRPVALPQAGAASGTPAATAAATATSGTGSGGVQAPNAAAQSVAARVASAAQGDALVWFSADGHWVAVCDRTTRDNPLVIEAPSATTVVAVVPGGCGGATVGALAWRPDSTGILLVPPAKPAVMYSLPTR